MADEKNLITEYVRWHVLTAFFSGYGQWSRICREMNWEKGITETEYSDYLYGTNAGIYVPLWASVCGDEKEALINKITLEVILFYKEMGYSPVYIEKNPPDYIGEQCRFMEYLSVQMLRGKKHIENKYETFLEKYLSRMVHAMKDVLKKYQPPKGIVRITDLLTEAVNRENREFKTALQWTAFESYSWRAGEKIIQPESEKMTTQTSFCDCGRKCKMTAKVAEGCVLSIGPDKEFKEKRFSGCARGHQYRQTFLSPHRLRYPMIRRGKRGEGLFKRISWDEAVQYIAGKIEDTIKNYGPGSRYVMPASGVGAAVRGDRFMKDLLALTGGYLNYYNYYSASCAEHALPYVYGTDVCGSSEEEMQKTKLLILWGHNPADTIWGDAFLPNLARAKKAGVKIIVIDPRQSSTALEYADEWIGILPSTDGAMVDAMAYEIWSRGLQDQDFMDRFCIGFDEEHMPEGIPRELNYRAYLFGETDGVVKTAEWASEITGVPAKRIRSLAIEYAETKPAWLMPGLGPQRTLNGEQNCRAFAMLACLTGNTGLSGGGSGGYQNKRGHISPSYELRDNPYPGKIPSFLWTKAVEKWGQLNDKDGLLGEEHLECGIKLIFNLASGMLINQHSDINETIRILSDETKVETIVVSELFMTPGAKYADLLLPGVSFFETENIVPPWNASDYLLYNQAAVPPLFEGRFEYEWIRETADRLGKSEELTKGREVSDWLSFLYEKTRKLEPELPDYHVFRQKGCFAFRNNPYQIAFQEQREKGIPFATPSGKIEIFSERLYKKALKDLPAIPCYVPCEEGAQDIQRKQFPLLLIGFHTKRRCHSIHDNNLYLDEVEYPELWMNPADAQKREILDGEMAEVFNGRGRIRIPVKVTCRIVEGAVALSEGGWYEPDSEGTDIRGSINTLTMSHRATPLAKANPQHTNIVEVCRVKDEKTKRE